MSERLEGRNIDITSLPQGGPAQFEQETGRKVHDRSQYVTESELRNIQRLFKEAIDLAQEIKKPQPRKR